MSQRTRALLLATAVVVAAAACTADLGSLDPSATSITRAWGINDTGVVVGESGGQPFRLAGPSSTLAALPLPTGVTGPAAALAVSNNGTIVGSASVAKRALLWRSDGTAVDISGGGLGEGLDVNDAGVVAGNINVTLQTGHLSTKAALWRAVAGSASGSTTPLTDLGFGSTPRAINASGDVVGSVYTGTVSRAARWSAPGYALVVLDGAPAYSAFATDIDDTGQVLVNNADSSGASSIVMYSATGTPKPIAGYPGNNFTQPTALSANGDIVGVTALGVGTPVRDAFRRTVDGTWSLLGSLGDTGSYAAAINACGDVVGSSAKGTSTRAVRWDGSGTCPTVG